MPNHMASVMLCLVDVPRRETRSSGSGEEGKWGAGRSGVKGDCSQDMLHEKKINKKKKERKFKKNGESGPCLSPFQKGNREGL